MNGVILDQSKVALCDRELGGGGFDTMEMGLFVTLAALTHATTNVAITGNELVLTGYARQGLTFSGSALTADFHARIGSSRHVL